MSRLKKILVLILSLVLGAFTLVGCKGNPEQEKKNEKAVIADGAYYTLFVNSFADSDGDGSGDLQGVIDNLDYLNDGKGGGLGVNGIWLMPIFTSQSVHKYDVMDYYSVSSSYGTMETLEKLIAACHERGMTLMLDLVLNCTSSRHPWFLDAYNNKNSPYRDYYQFYSDLEDPQNYDIEEKWWVNKDYPVWQPLINGDSFVGIYHKSMPDLNFRSEKLRAEAKKIAKFWLDKGVDGFRLDSAMHLFSNGELPKVNGETPDFHAANVEWWQEFYDYCQTVKENTYLVGEVWTDTEVRAEYLKPLKSNFNFSVGGFIIDAVNESKPANTFAEKVDEVYKAYDKVTLDYIDSPFLTNHDMPRTASIIGDDLAKLKLAASMYLTLEGNPYLYYGEELGQAGDGEANRNSFCWGEGNKYNVTRFSEEKPVKGVSEQAKNPDSLYNHYKNILKVRNENKAFKGEFSIVKANEKLIAYKMTYDGQEALIVHNTTKEVLELGMGISDFSKVFETTNGYSENKVNAQSSVIFIK